jgi:hypothetical protein
VVACFERRSLHCVRRMVISRECSSMKTGLRDTFPVRSLLTEVRVRPLYIFARECNTIYYIDPTVFDGILSYLRSSHSIFPGTMEELYLRRLLIEADYYQLSGLADSVRTELAERNKRETNAAAHDKTMQKVVGAAEVQQQLSLGWSYVANYEGNETNACAAHGSKVEALWRSNQCTACGEFMGYDKFLKHVTFFRPRQVVLQKAVSGGIPNNDSLRELDTVGLVFDSSFG